MSKFDFYQCQKCFEIFAVEADQYDEPMCQCGLDNTIHIGTKSVEFEN